jgi:hypothetical protein
MPNVSILTAACISAAGSPGPNTIFSLAKGASGGCGGISIPEQGRSERPWRCGYNMALRKIEVKEGDRYHQLTVCSEIEGMSVSNRTVRMVLCKCDCGKIVRVRLDYLRSGHTKSCNCRRKTSASKTHKKHGEYNTSLYSVWRSMLNRCFNKNVKSFVDYGNRGITVCREWLEYEPFSQWAKRNGYKKTLTIERIDNNGDYEPANCKFISKAAQANNKRNNRFLLFKGKSLTVAQWGRKTGIHPGTIESRLKAGWETKKALTHPVRTRCD